MPFDPIKLLKQVFPGMSDVAVRQMAALAKTTTYPPGTVLCHEGAEEEVFYIIGEGQVRVTQKLGNEERFLRFSGPGAYFGEMALIANTPRNATVVTTTSSAFLEVDKETFIEIIRQNPIIALTMFRTSVGWLRANDMSAIGELTSQKQALEQAYQTLRERERQRSEFLTTLAHEVRTPLTTANGYMQLIMKGTMTGPALQMGLKHVANGLERIVSLVNDLFFVQEMDLIAAALRPVDLTEVLRIITEEAEDRATENNLTIRLHIPSVLPAVEADPDGLLRALRALVDNAIKFSPDGGDIHINVGVFSDYTEIAVTDPGIGIEPEAIPHIFKQFHHQEKRGEHLFGGLGLGLAIANHLIESFGGSIRVESQVGQGSTFTVRLPTLARTESESTGIGPASQADAQ